MKRAALILVLEWAHEVSDSVTCALGWGLAFMVGATERPQLTRVGNVVYLPGVKP